jgi:hypothetical protein
MSALGHKRTFGYLFDHLVGNREQRKYPTISAARIVASGRVTLIVQAAQLSSDLPGTVPDQLVVRTAEQAAHRSR